VEKAPFDLSTVESRKAWFETHFLLGPIAFSIPFLVVFVGFGVVEGVSWEKWLVTSVSMEVILVVWLYFKLRAEYRGREDADFFRSAGTEDDDWR
jgi:hypothetical protein